MKKRLTNNWGLKLISFVFAILLWLVVVNVDNPVKTKVFDNVPVKMQNTDLLTDEGLIYEVLDSSNTVSVSVSAPRSYLELLSKDDIVAVADFNNITAANTINITYYSRRYNDKITNFKGNIESVKLNVEPEKTVQFVLKTNTVGVVEEGYVIGNITTDQNQVRISGPESLVSQIKSASVAVNVSDTTTNIATYADVKLYDKDGNEVSAPSLEKNVDSVKITVEVLAMKMVPVTCVVTGTPADGYRTTGEVLITPSEIAIAGSAETLQNVSKIEISSEELDITGLDKDFVVSHNIKTYLPAGVSLADDSFNGKVGITVHIEEEQEVELKLGKANIAFINVPPQYRASVDEDVEISLYISGLSADISALMTQDVVGIIDITEYMRANNSLRLEEGAHKMEIAFDFGENITVMEPVEVDVVIQKAEE